MRSGVAAATIAAVLAGCGASSAGPHKVALSLLAPTSGVTVNVHALVVYGKVTPATATVTVGGRPVAVVKGTFRQPVLMRGKVAHIHLSAHARGYEGARLEATVFYKPGPRSLQDSGALASGVIGSTVGAGAGNATSVYGSPTLAATLFGPGSRSSFINQCAGNKAGCACLYDHLAGNPALRTPAQRFAFVERVAHAYEYARSPSDFPPLFVKVVGECAGELG